ncbi:MAG: CoA transferase [Dehalococcoidia bacterium]
MTRYPLTNLRVINFGWVWAAPVLGHTLADMGAQVIKIETHKRPDVVRFLPPSIHEDHPLESLYCANTFRNLLGVTLDLTSARGQELAWDMVRSADVVIENFTPGTVKRYGLDYPSVRALRPDVVMISLSAAGQDGPSAKIATYGNIISCLAGLDAHQGYIGDDRPTSYGTSIPDPMMGILGAFVVLSALRYRARTGKGQYIDLSQWEACAATLGGPIMDYMFNGRIQYPKANRDDLMAPHGVYPSKGRDRWVSIAVKTEEEWLALCDAMERPDLADDERFADLYSRQMHHDELDRIIGQWTSSQTHRQVTRKLQRAGIAAFPSLSAKETFDDRHYAARNDWVEVDHPLGKEVIYGMPWKLSKTPGGIQRPAPMMGQHNQFVYGEILGRPAAEVTALEAEKVLY